MAALLANQGEFQGKRFLSVETLAQSLAPLPWMPDHVVNRNVTFSMGGWGLNLTFPGNSLGWHGWGGVGGSMVFWNPQKRIAFSYVMNSLSYNGIGDERSWRLMSHLVQAVEQAS